MRVILDEGIRSDALNEISSAMNTQVAMRHTIAYTGKTAVIGHIESVEPFDPDHSGLQFGSLGPTTDKTVTPPSLLTRIPPIYPDAARLSSRSGVVVLHMRILANGKHSAIDTVASTGSIFAQAALDSVNRWVYRPMKRNGVATESDAMIFIAFLPESKTSEIPQVLISEHDNP